MSKNKNCFNKVKKLPNNIVYLSYLALIEGVFFGFLGISWNINYLLQFQHILIGFISDFLQNRSIFIRLPYRLLFLTILFLIVGIPIMIFFGKVAFLLTIPLGVISFFSLLFPLKSQIIKEVIIDESAEKKDRNCSRVFLNLLHYTGLLLATIPLFSNFSLSFISKGIFSNFGLIIVVLIIKLILGTFFLAYKKSQKIENIYTPRSIKVFPAPKVIIKHMNSGILNPMLMSLVFYSSKPWYVKIVLFLLNIAINFKKGNMVPYLQYAILAINSPFENFHNIFGLLIVFFGQLLGLGSFINCIFSLIIFCTWPQAAFILLYNFAYSATGFLTNSSYPMKFLSIAGTPLLIFHLLPNFTNNSLILNISKYLLVFLSIFWKHLGQIKLNMSLVTNFLMGGSKSEKHNLLKELGYFFLTLLGLYASYLCGPYYLLIYALVCLLFYGTSLIFLPIVGGILTFFIKTLGMVALIKNPVFVKIVGAFFMYLITPFFFPKDMKIVQSIRSVLMLLPFWKKLTMIFPLGASLAYNKFFKGKLFTRNFLAITALMLVCLFLNNFYFTSLLGLIVLILLVYNTMVDLPKPKNILRKLSIFFLSFGVSYLLKRNMNFSIIISFIITNLSKYLMESILIKQLFSNKLSKFIYTLVIGFFISLGGLNHSFFNNLASIVGFKNGNIITCFFLYLGGFLGSLFLIKNVNNQKTKGLMLFSSQIFAHLLPVFFTNKIGVAIGMLLMGVSMGLSRVVLPAMVSKSIDQHNIKGILFGTLCFALLLGKIILSHGFGFGVLGTNIALYKNCLLKTTIFPLIGGFLYFMHGRS